MPASDELLRDLEAAAVDLARGAGEILAGHFGRQVDVEYKDEDRRDPVTNADKECQEYLTKEIERRFPDHGILGEEGPEDADTPCPDTLWVLDPLDGTTNFLNGLPVYASSIGVLRLGRPAAAALFIPWPKPGGGFVLHCRRGGGCFADDEPVSVFEGQEPEPNRLIGVPGHFGVTNRFSRKLSSKAGEMRTTGSIAYELAMTACGVMQYAVFSAPRIWDMAAGALAVMEAGGTVMIRLPGERRWRPLDSLVPFWESQPPSLKELRKWTAPLVSGNSQIAPLMAANIRSRFRPLAGLRRLSRRLHRVRKS